MATLKLLPAIRTAMITALLGAIDAAAGPCTIEIYAGAMPANVTDAPAGAKLGTLTCNDPAGTVATGALTFGVIAQDSSADNTGTAAWGRLLEGSGAPQLLFDVSDASGTGVLKLNSTSIVTGGPISISSFVFTMGGA